MIDRLSDDSYRLIVWSHHALYIAQPCLFPTLYIKEEGPKALSITMLLVLQARTLHFFRKQPP